MLVVVCGDEVVVRAHAGSCWFEVVLRWVGYHQRVLVRAPAGSWWFVLVVVCAGLKWFEGVRVSSTSAGLCWFVLVCVFVGATSAGLCWLGSHQRDSRQCIHQD